jgi:hypothetical protein
MTAFFIYKTVTTTTTKTKQTLFVTIEEKLIREKYGKRFRN